MLPGTLTATVFSSHIVSALEGSGTIGWWILGAAVTAMALGLVALFWSAIQEGYSRLRTSMA